MTAKIALNEASDIRPGEDWPSAANDRTTRPQAARAAAGCAGMRPTVARRHFRPNSRGAPGV